MTVEEITAVLQHWMVHDVKNTPIGLFVTDNQSCFTCSEFTSFMALHRVPTQYSCAYHQHQNGGGEALWFRLGLLTRVNLRIAPHLGGRFWTDAMIYANDVLQYTPSRANHDNAPPMALWEDRAITMADLRLFKPFGSAAYVHEPGSVVGQVTTGRKGYLLGRSPMHAAHVYHVVMADLNSYRNTGDVRWRPTCSAIDPLTAPEDIQLVLQRSDDRLVWEEVNDLRDDDKVAKPMTDTTAAEPVRPVGAPMAAEEDGVREALEDKDSGVTGPRTRSKRAAKARQDHAERQRQDQEQQRQRRSATDHKSPWLAKTRYPLHAVLALGDVSRCNSAVKLRCIRRAGRTVATALGMRYKTSAGTWQWYSNGELNYDIERGYLRVVPTDAHTDKPVAVRGVDGAPDVPGYIEPHTSAEWEFFDTEARTCIQHHSDVDPLGTRGCYALDVEFDGVLSHYSFVPDHMPHATDGTSVSAVRPWPEKGIVIASHKDMKKLDIYSRKDDALAAILEEYSTLDRRGVWKLVERRADEKVHTGLVLIKIKYKPSGEEDRVKARYVVNGKSFVKHVDCGETFAPTTELTTVKAMIFDACQHRKRLVAWDVKGAFQVGVPDRRTLVHIPPGRPLVRDTKGNPMVYEFVRNMYGVPSAPRRFHVELHNCFVRFGCRQSHADPCLYMIDIDGVRINVVAYVDDVLCSYEDTACGLAAYGKFIQHVKGRFELQDDGFQEAAAFIGMSITWNADRSAVSIGQPGAIDKVLEEHSMTNAHRVDTPAEHGVLLSDLESPVAGPSGAADRDRMQKLPYRRRVGSLLWLSRCTLPMITYAVNCLARVGHNPGPAHWDATSRVLKYLKGVREYELVFRRDDSLKPGQFRPLMYSDASYAPSYGSQYDNYRSTTGWIATVNGTALTWRSRKQSLVAQSSAEAEWYAAGDAAKEAIHLKRLFADLGTPFVGPVPLLIDNQSAIKQAFNNCDLERSRHVAVRSHFLRERTRRGEVGPVWCPGDDNIADQFTKPLGRVKFMDQSSRLGMLPHSVFLQECDSGNAGAAVGTRRVMFAV